MAIKKFETVSVFMDIRKDLQKDQMHRYMFIVATTRVRLMLRVAKVYILHMHIFSMTLFSYFKDFLGMPKGKTYLCI